MYIQCMHLMRISGSKKLKLIDETDQKDQNPSRLTWEHIIRVQLVVFHLSLLKLEIPKKYLQTLEHFLRIIHFTCY